MVDYVAILKANPNGVLATQDNGKITGESLRFFLHPLCQFYTSSFGKRQSRICK